MKTLLLIALTALIASGCATARTGVAYVPNDREAAYSPAQAGRAFAECRKTALTHDQETACMYLKGYSVERVNLDTRQPLEGKPVKFAPESPSRLGGASLPVAPNTVRLTD